MRSSNRRLIVTVALSLLVPLSLSGCGGARPAAKSPTEQLRQAARGNRDVATLERWFIAELLEPKGRYNEALQARKRIEELGGPVTAQGELAFALDDHFHGRLKTAPGRYLKAAEKARLQTADPNSEVLAWAAVHYAIDLKRNDPDLFVRSKDFIMKAIAEPMALGWRARGELVDLYLTELGRNGDKQGEQSQLERAAEEFGCVKALRLAGPFGHGAGRDLERKYDAELPGPWPERWTPEAGIERSPSQLKTERNGCIVEAADPVGDGIFYAETYLELKEARDLIIAIQGARAVFVDDHLVLDRDTRKFGIWPKFGVRLRLVAGRHRIVARTNSSRSSIRILDPEGRPAKVTTTTAAAAPYVIRPPEIGPEPNVVSRYLKNDKPVIPADPMLRFALASLAEVEGQSDVASLFIEPEIEKLDDATGTSLLLAARFTEQDPLYSQDQTRDLIRGLHEKAVKSDPELWEPQLSLLLFQAEQAGPKEAIAALEALAKRHPEVPGIVGSLVRLYRQLGWIVPYERSVEAMLQGFPKHVDALVNGVELYDARGKWAAADALAARILELDGDNEIALRRALSREDYAAAIAELRRLGKRHPDRKDTAERISDVLERSGDLKGTAERLAELLAKNPKDSGARHAKADFDYSRGNRDALRVAVVEAIEVGASNQSLQEALDLVEGMTELEPYRLNSQAIIEAFQKSGRQLPGTAARVLDYAAIWVHADGSSRMLEHEIVHLQSAEAIRDFAEYSPPEGLLLRLRVVKPDGRTFEPLRVASKPTVTFPHLEVGDYVETEVIVRFEGDGQHGKTYLGPTWFFREEKLAYDRSELVIISPESRPLMIESQGGAPEPTVEHRDGVVIRRFRVDDSPLAPSEPYRPSARETMPNVRLGWGADPKLRLREFIDATAVLTPMDPRIVRVAKRIVEGVEGGNLKRAQRLYHYVMDNIEDGEQLDGRQIIMGRRGNRWRGFIELCRALDIPYVFGVAKNRLNLPPVGPIDAMTEYSALFLRVGDAKHSVDLTIGDKFTPFGYLPAEIRGASGFLLDSDPPRAMTLSQGSTLDQFNTVLRGRLSADGTATFEIEQTLSGKPAIVLRDIVASAPEAQLRSFVESKLIAPSLKGARLIQFEFSERDQSDKSLVLKSRVEVPRFAEKHARGLSVTVPFTPRIGALGALAARETPMVLDDSSDQSQRLELELPAGAKLSTVSAKKEFKHGDRTVVIHDRIEGNRLVLERRTIIPAGRVSVQDYPEFAAFVRQAGSALSADVQIEMGR